MLHSLTPPREDWVICFVGLGAGGAALGKTPGRISCCPLPVLPPARLSHYSTSQDRVGSLSCFLLSPQPP